jgi:hypothetical protein
VQRLFTMICEFRGGTYISQVYATDESAAISQWCAKIAADMPIPDASHIVAKAFDELYDVEVPVLLDGLRNIWCASASCDGDMALLNIVMTREVPSRPEVFG